MTPPQRLPAPIALLALLARPVRFLSALLLTAAPLAAWSTPADIPPAAAPIQVALDRDIADTTALSVANAPRVVHAWLRDDPGVPLRDRIVSASLAELGVRYTWGGDNPKEGFDCSGLVKFIYANIAEIDLPHRARQQRGMGKPVKRQHLQPGDLVFFNTMRHPASHVGIYIGDGKFVHAPSRGARVRIDSMRNAYWAKRYTSARRYVEPQTRTASRV